MSIKWSYSAYKTFDQCPKQYHEVKVLKRYQSDQNTAALIFGRDVHKAIEDHLKDGTELAPNYKKFHKFVDRIKGLPGNLYVEYPMGLREDGTACDFYAEDVWWRGIPDVLVVNEGTAWVGDWKTGKSARYADTDQLELLALATFAMFPQVNKVKGALMFIVANDVVKKTFYRKDLPIIMSRWIGNVSRINAAMESGIWNARNSPLCKFCPVRDCDYYRG